LRVKKKETKIIEGPSRRGVGKDSIKAMSRGRREAGGGRASPKAGVIVGKEKYSPLPGGALRGEHHVRVELDVDPTTGQGKHGGKNSNEFALNHFDTGR